MQVFTVAIRYKDSKEEKNNTFLLCEDATPQSFSICKFAYRNDHLLQYFIICKFAYRNNHANRFSNTIPSFVKLFSNTSPSL